jgi:hypothetical protein
MPVPVPRLRVHPNPFVGSDHDGSSIDHLGRPAGRVNCDYYEHSKTGFVGAKLTDVVETHPAQSFKVGKKSFDAAPARHDHRVSYSRVSVEIPNTAYYRAAVKSGALFAADKKTWIACGGSAVTFVEPANALMKARAAAIELFNAATGEGAHQEMGSNEPLWFGGDDAATPVAPAAPVTASSAEVAPTDDTSEGAV